MKTIPKLCVCTLLCTGLLLGGSAVFAVDEDPQSDVTVTFEENTDPTDPVDPDNPDKKPDPEYPGTGMQGPLSLDYVSDLPFPTNIKITGNDEDYYSTNEKPYIQITDNRGVGTGWKVTAAMSGFTRDVLVEGETVTEASLPGAVLTLSGGFALSSNATLDKPYAQPSVRLSADSSNVRVITGRVQEVEEVQYGAGTGTWVNRWYPANGDPAGVNTNVTLTVYGGTAAVGKHTATITWTLSDAP